MSGSIFRKAALERLSTPEQLDQLVPITSPKAWLLLLGLIAIFIGALVWAVTGQATTGVRARTLLVEQGGIMLVASPYAGQVIELDSRLLAAGQEVIVAEGDPLAVIKSAEGEESLVVTSPFDGRVLEVRTAPGAIINSGDPIVSLEPATTESALEAILYLPSEQAGPVAVGQSVRISPDGLPPQSSGFLLGEVAAVAPFPSSPDGVLSTLGNEGLVEVLDVGPAPIEIRVRLLPDPDNAGHWLWTLMPGPDERVSSGVLGQAEIILEEKPPISLLIGG